MTYVIRCASMRDDRYLHADGTWGPYKGAKRFGSQGEAAAFHEEHFPGSERYGVFPCSAPKEVPKHLYKVRIEATRRGRVGGVREVHALSTTALEARSAAFQVWFGEGSYYWDSHETRGPAVGRVVRQRLRKSHGKPRFVDEPVTDWVKLTVRP